MGDNLITLIHGCHERLIHIFCISHWVSAYKGMLFLCSGDLPARNLTGDRTFFESLILLNASDNRFQGSLPEAFGQIGFFQQVLPAT